MPEPAPQPSPHLPPPPPVPAADAHLFLDFDGTLVPIAERPDGVVVDDDLHDLLASLAAAMPGRVAVLSGRSVQQLDALLGPVASALDLGGSHGAEFRAAGGAVEAAAPPAAMAAVAAAAAAFAARHPGTMAELKTMGAAIHYRAGPEHEAAAHALAERLAADNGLVVQHGKMVAEVRAPGSKGAALATLLARAGGGTPVMLGDDVTDEDAFQAAAALGGVGVLVGPPRATAAAARLDDPAAVRAWLRGLLAERGA